MANEAIDDRAALSRELGEAMDQLTATAMTVQTAVLKPYGLTLIQSFPLKLLWVRNEPMDMAQLCDALALPPSTMTSVVDRLERDGLAQRQPHATDRRRVSVVITPRGREVMEELHAHSVRTGVRVLEGIPDSEIEVTSVVLRRIAEALLRLEATGELGG